jgi:tRNA pseudouridine55 synthase
MNGVLNIDKPRGITSHDVVLQVRRLLREKRIGHTGTLDPLATGVLVLCLGKATRIAQYLEAGEKEYTAEMRLGIVTDTLDAEGRVLENIQYQSPNLSHVLDVLGRFTGAITQTPPVYSAIKVGGIASYKLARLGKAAPLKPRPVTIHALELLEYNDPLVRLSVRCSKGAYIRTLCSDIGAALGTGAHMTNLRRTASGSFRIEDSVTLDQVTMAASEGGVGDMIISMNRALENIPFISVNADDSTKIANGVRITGREAIFRVDRDLVRIHDHSGELLALGSTRNGELRPLTVFADPESVSAG